MFTTIASAQGWSLGRYRCGAPRHAAAAEEASSTHHVAFVRAGYFVKQVGSARIAADATRAVFFPRGEVYRVHHPVDGGDDSFVLSFDDEFLRAAAGDLGDGESADRAALPSGAVRLTPPMTLALTATFVRAARRGDSLASEEAVCRLTTATIAPALAGGATGRPVPADREARVRAVQQVMAARFDCRLRLPDLAAAVEWSPFQLVRAFRAVTGGSVHQYLTDLRVAAAVARLADGERDLARLALDCGFADHSHLANVFRSRTAATPSEARRILQDA